MNRIRSSINLRNFMWLALVLAMTGSITHVAFAFATLENGSLVMGYIQALAVDVGMLSLAVGINQRRRVNRKTLAIWIGVGIFTLISVYANLLHGAVFQSKVNAGTWGWLLAWRPILLSAFLPILVIYLTEVVGDDETYLAVSMQEAQRIQNEFDSLKKQLDDERIRNEGLLKDIAEQDAQLHILAEGAKSPELDTTEKLRQERGDYLMKRFIEVLGEQDEKNPYSQKQLAGILGVSEPTMSKLVTKAVAAGLVSKNGHIVKVVHETTGV